MQQTGCQIFSACSQSQFTDSNFIDKIFDESKRSTCLIHVNGDVDDVKVRRLSAIADEFRTTKGDPTKLERFLNGNENLMATAFHLL